MGVMSAFLPSQTGFLRVFGTGAPLVAKVWGRTHRLRVKPTDNIHSKAGIDLPSGDQLEKDKLENSPHLMWSQGPQDTRLDTVLQVSSIHAWERGVTCRLVDRATSQPPLVASLGSDMEAFQVAPVVP